MKNLLRVRVWPYDFNGGHSLMSYVTSVASFSDLEGIGWKFEIA